MSYYLHRLLRIAHVWVPAYLAALAILLAFAWALVGFDHTDGVNFLIGMAIGFPACWVASWVTHISVPDDAA